MLDSSCRNDMLGTGGAPCASGGLGERDARTDRTPELLVRFPSLARVGRVPFGAFPTPVERVEMPGVRPALWIKRDDLDAGALSGPRARCAGGNKLRALEFLLARVRAGDTVLAPGGVGSTHVLVTALLARRVGARTVAVRWPHEMNDTARNVDRLTRETVDEARLARGPMRAIAAAWLATHLARGPGTAWLIPPGGASPVGMLGAVNAGLELAAQAARGDLPAPAHVVLPLGTGGTAAGLALGFAIAGFECPVVAVRVVPRVVANRGRMLHLARRCARLIERATGTRLPAVRGDRVRVLHGYYGGAYGRPLGAAREVRRAFERATGAALDETYGAKAFTAAAQLANATDGPTLYWLTFDARSVMEPAGACDTAVVNGGPVA